MWISQGADLEKVSEDLLKIKAERDKSNPISKIGIGAQETNRFSITRAIQGNRGKGLGKDRSIRVGVQPSS